MELFEAIRSRRSCRNFAPDPVEEKVIEKILEAASWAPSPLNSQPWEFIVITRPETKGKIFAEGERCRKWALEKTGWKWLGAYSTAFLSSAPVLVAVIGDPQKTGVDLFMEEGSMGYQAACAAAIQNIHLAAHALGLGSLWYTLFDKKIMREILGVAPEKIPLALVCIGKPERSSAPPPRKDLKEKVTYLR